jgi:hypothetical protein
MVNTTEKVKILLDSGSSVNFVSEVMAKKLKLDWVDKIPFAIDNVNEEEVEIGVGTV